MTRELGTKADPIWPDRTGLTPEQGVQLWIDLMETCDQLLIAGLQASLPPDGDLRTAYRQWHAETMREHDEMIVRMAGEFTKRMTKNAS